MYRFLSFILLCFILITISPSFAQNNCFDFDGANDFINIPSASGLISGSSAISMSCWVYPTDPIGGWPNFDGFLGFRNESNADFYILQLNPTTVEGRFRNSSGTTYTLTQTGLINNTWQHFVLTYDGSNLTIYLNGVAGSSVPASGMITNSMVDFFIGKLEFGATNFSLDGKIDEVGLWDKALSAIEINCMYAYGINPTDANLQLYYDFDHGIAGGTNTGITTLVDRMGNINGQVTGAALTGSFSNWVAGKSTHTQIADTICVGDSLTFGTQTVYTLGVYYELYSIPGSCDSIVALTLTADSITGTDIRSECSPYTWIDGNAYTSNNNTATHTIPGGSSNGCDSIVTLDLTIVSPPTGTDTRTECDAYTWIDGNTYTATNNIATHTITGGASNGCDSIVTLNLTIINSSTGTDTHTECDTYTWIDGNTYTASNNTATHTITGGASNGCDSIVTLNLTIINSSTSTDAHTECDAYTWIDGNTYTSSNNTATHTIAGGASNGCDSIITLDLTIVTVDIGVTQNGSTLSSNAAGAAYQWLDCNDNLSVISGESNVSFIAQSNGSYAVEITQSGCVDTSACTSVTTVGIISNNFSENIMIYPNPTNGKVTVDLGQSYSIITSEVLSINGQLIKTEVHENMQQVPVLLLDEVSGMYLIKLSDNNSKKMIIKVLKK